MTQPTAESERPVFEQMVRMFGHEIAVKLLIIRQKHEGNAQAHANLQDEKDSKTP